MELLYFISGILSVGITYSIVLLRKNQSNYTSALEKLQSFMNISSVNVAELRDTVSLVEEKYFDIIEKLEKDQYASISEINERLKDLSRQTNAMNERLSQVSKTLNNHISQSSVERNTLKNNFKKLSQDPNFIR
jgi:CTP synthase (UTP-ammonia lyase)